MKYDMSQVEGNIVDIYNRRIYPGVITIEKGVITKIAENSKKYSVYITPGWIDAHVHIESSMLLPEAFSDLVIRKGTVAIVNDPHEIGNVLGIEGINFMIRHSKNSSVKMFFTIPSCVPATPFDSAGSCINSDQTEELIKTGNFIGLSEMMNIPGVLHKDPEVIKKLNLAIQHHLVIDGHAPGVRGKDLRTYIQAGITTDHECTTLDEAIEKIGLGMKILIREGSAAKNYTSLHSLIGLYPERVMFCTDDSHPHDLLTLGHIDKIIKKAISDGYDLFDVLKIACINPIENYKLDVGTLRIGDPADFVIVKNLVDFQVSQVFINGKEKFNIANKNANPEKLKKTADLYINYFDRLPLVLSDLYQEVEKEIVCIKIIQDEIITQKQLISIDAASKNFESDLEKDVLKIVYLNRYKNTKPRIAYITGIGLQRGAFASSISHDSHNIIGVGSNDGDLLLAINELISYKGGLTIIESRNKMTLPLPVAGIMSDKPGEEIAEMWERMISTLKDMGCRLDSPFMTLSFMSLLVIPELKIGEQGLFEYEKFSFIEG